jgi:BMFP domain-containing protein YqiC
MRSFPKNIISAINQSLSESAEDKAVEKEDVEDKKPTTLSTLENRVAILEARLSKLLPTEK